MSSDIKLVVGLGNPGQKYADTRHNIGVMIVDEICGRLGLTLKAHKKTNTMVAEAPGLVVARTREFMNLSGGPVKALVKYYRVAINDVIIIHDELEMEFGQTILRTGGDHGHNGLKSVTTALKNRDYQKLSVGIGRPPGRMAPAAFVLKPFTKAEKMELPIVRADAADLVLKA